MKSKGLTGQAVSCLYRASARVSTSSTLSFMVSSLMCCRKGRVRCMPAFLLGLEGSRLAPGVQGLARRGLQDSLAWHHVTQHPLLAHLDTGTQ